jgi:glutathione S-transferase
VRTVVATTRPHAPRMEENPLSKIPTLVLDDGTVLYDSPVICEYLDSLHAGRKLVPADGKERMTALRRQALGDGFLDFLLLLRNEREREHPSPVHVATFGTKKQAALKALDNEAGDLAASAFTVGHVAIGCALSYLDFRFGDEDWRSAHPGIARWHRNYCQRPSVRATEPVDDS